MSNLTKQHFEAIATIIRQHYEAEGLDFTRERLEWLALDLASYLEKQNPLFNLKKFLLACGIKD